MNRRDDINFFGEKIMHEGHRSRMIEKLATAESLADHELIEILLFNAIPRKNTNDIAHRLLEKYSTLSNIFDASVEDLADVEGIGLNTAAYLKVIGLIFKKYSPAKPEIERFDRNIFGDYLIRRYHDIKYEMLDVFILDNNRKIKKVRTFTNISADSVDVDPKQIVKFLIDSDAFAVVFAHNHPFGENTPSEMDDRFTKQCQLVCSINNIRLLDHYVVGTNGALSYLESGRLYSINRNFSIQKVLDEN